MTSRHKILYFIKKFNRAIHQKLFFFQKSVTIWNSLQEDRINYKTNLTNIKSEKEFKKHFFYYLKKIRHWQPMEELHGDFSDFFNQNS